MTGAKHELYKAALLAYEALKESGRGAPAPEQIREKLVSLLRGLSIEDEFISLCLWSSRHLLVHKLDQEVFSAAADFQMPDILCIVSYEEKQIPFLVEVKTSAKPRKRFSKGYVEKLMRYADAVRLPLLVAYKYTGFGARPLWSLFEIRQMRTASGAYRIVMPEMIKHDLTGVLLGNFHVQIWEGTSICMTMTKEKVISDKEFVGKLTDVYWQTRDNKRADKDWLLEWLFMLTQDEVEIDDLPDRVIQRFKKVTDEGAIAYWALYQALPVDRYRLGEQVDWASLIQEHPFRFPCKTLGVQQLLQLKRAW
ncbi:MAG: hypothetical protein EXR53_00370 [Dehalococcoidia bacterium]|nr:hypothetical protein [Dehalococcoidia bacterium]